MILNSNPHCDRCNAAAAAENVSSRMTRVTRCVPEITCLTCTALNSRRGIGEGVDPYLTRVLVILTKMKKIRKFWLKVKWNNNFLVNAFEGRLQKYSSTVFRSERNGGNFPTICRVPQFPVFRRRKTIRETESYKW